jgi:hypothetical protein
MEIIEKTVLVSKRPTHLKATEQAWSIDERRLMTLRTAAQYTKIFRAGQGSASIEPVRSVTAAFGAETLKTLV